MTPKHWAYSVGIGLLVAILTWTGLNLGRMLYADWAFLHAVRVNSERAVPQQASPPPPQGR